MSKTELSFKPEVTRIDDKIKKQYLTIVETIYQI